MTKNDQMIRDLEARVEKLESDNRDLVRAMCDLIAKMPQQPVTIYVPYAPAPVQPYYPWTITWTNENKLDDGHKTDCPTSYMVLSPC